MERKLIVLLLSSAVTASFFFPLFNWNSYEMSGLNYILSTQTPSYKYFLLLIPFISVFIFLMAYYNENFISTPKLISWTPLLVLVLVFMVGSVKEGFINLLSKLDIGFWMTLIFSLLLALTLDKGKPAQTHHSSFAKVGPT
jgi:magnesium-transporting ATPase (P-type)